MKPRWLVVPVLAALALAGGAGAVNGNANFRAICPSAPVDTARCHADVVTDGQGNPQASGLPSGYGPLQFRTAYGVANASSSQTIAIVDAYDDPQAENDLTTYSNTFGIPTCTTANGCFSKVDQNGGTNYPRADQGWALEISLDIQIAHGMCPTCHILLVEAKSNSFTNLMAAVDYAVAHAQVISNSYGGSEFSGETSYDSHFNVGKPITVSSGDNGYGVEYPAASQYVTAVGGTTLNLSSNTRSSETAWSGAGSGCSAYEPKPSWQTDSGCSRRTVADVSADANPSTGAAVYDSQGYQGRRGWFVVGGTSLASPLIAAVYALAGNGATASYSYAHSGSLYDITSGSNGSCGGSYLCTAVTGYDGPTGLGSPNGTGGF
jgi:subtilase family serine protease